MMWLQSNDDYDTLGTLDLDTGKFETCSRRLAQQSIPDHFGGLFATLSGVVVALYRHGNELFVRVGAITFPLATDVVAEVNGPATERTLLVIKDGGEILRHKYELDLSIRFSDDPTPFIDDEDFDFGLFISNVSKAPKRKTALIDHFQGR